MKDQKQTHEQQAVHPPVHGDADDAPWASTSNLGAPPPREGMGQRWIRVALRGADDGQNVAKSLREGWQPRQWETVPEDWKSLRVDEGKWAGCIAVHGMILCEMPLARVRKRDEHFRAITERMTQAIENDLAREVPSVQRQSETNVAVGRRPKVAEDS